MEIHQNNSQSNKSNPYSPAFNTEFRPSFEKVSRCGKCGGYNLIIEINNYKVCKDCGNEDQKLFTAKDFDAYREAEIERVEELMRPNNLPYGYDPPSLPR